LFAEEKVNLKQSEVDDQRAQVNRLRDRIEAKIAVSPGYGFVKALHAGSVAKGTALRNVNKKVYLTHLAQLIRFTKWWARQQKRRDGEFKCKSFMLELLWIHLADGVLVLGDYAEAFEQFFAFIASGGLNEQIAFTDFHPASDLPGRGSMPIQILDPVNFENNVAEHYEARDRDRLVSAAQEAFDAISTGPIRSCGASEELSASDAEHHPGRGPSEKEYCSPGISALDQ
jgi:hypothetical protein